MKIIYNILIIHYCWLTVYRIPRIDNLISEIEFILVIFTVRVTAVTECELSQL